jgi:hypothetical protein
VSLIACLLSLLGPAEHEGTSIIATLRLKVHRVSVCAAAHAFEYHSTT